MTRFIFARLLTTALCLFVIAASLTGCGKKDEDLNPTKTDAGKAAQYRSTYGAAPAKSGGGASRPMYGSPGGSPPGPAGR